ncbi:hypothetical protein DL96DRAFT_1720643 [Flagelloscypha sp. PMI_526]|nr:hypothetical protein DL96DRAFT_1720643 [Flagelloscypha sp. PMI_526]
MRVAIQRVCPTSSYHIFFSPSTRRIQPPRVLGQFPFRVTNPYESQSTGIVSLVTSQTHLSTQPQHSADSNVSSSSSFGAQPAVSSPLGPWKITLPSPCPVLNQFITGSRRKLARNLVVRTYAPSFHIITQSSSLSSTSTSSLRPFVLKGANGETGDWWSQSLLSSTLSFRATAGKFSFNGHRSSATTMTRMRTEQVRAILLSRKEEYAAHANDQEGECKEKEDTDEDDEDKSGTITIDDAPPMRAATPPGLIQVLANVLINQALNYH